MQTAFMLYNNINILCIITLSRICFGTEYWGVSFILDQGASYCNWDRNSAGLSQLTLYTCYVGMLYFLYSLLLKLSIYLRLYLMLLGYIILTSVKTLTNLNFYGCYQLFMVNGIFYICHQLKLRKLHPKLC